MYIVMRIPKATLNKIKEELERNSSSPESVDNSKYKASVIHLNEEKAIAEARKLALRESDMFVVFKAELAIQPFVTTLRKLEDGDV